MKLVELFDSRDKKKRLSHIRNLVLLACSDGSFDRVEMDLIFKIGVRSGLAPDELTRIFSRPDSIRFFPPESYRERIEQLYDLVLVMMIDGDIHENEINICKSIAIKLGFNHNVIDRIVIETIDTIAKGIATELAIAHLMEAV